MKRTKVLFILLIVLFTTITIVSIVYFFYTTVAIKEYPMLLIVRENIGIDVGTDIIRFGGVKPGGGSTRILFITNNHPIDVKVNMHIFGDLKDYVGLSQNNFLIKSGETKEIEISVAVPIDMPYGNYTSKLRVIFKRKT